MVALRRPPAQAGRRSSSSGRAVASRSSGPLDLPDHPLEQAEQRLLRPVEVLDEHDRGPLARQLGQELGPGLVQAVAGRHRVQLAGHVEAEGEPEDLPAAQAAEHSVGRVAVEDAEEGSPSGASR